MQPVLKWRCGCDECFFDSALTDSQISRTDNSLWHATRVLVNRLHNIRLMNIARPESKQRRQILRSAASVVFGSGDQWNFAAHTRGARVEPGTVWTETVKLESMLCPVRGLETLFSQLREFPRQIPAETDALDRRRATVRDSRTAPKTSGPTASH